MNVQEQARRRWDSIAKPLYSLGKLEENYGSLEAFFIKKLNFTSEETEAIKAKFLV